MWTPLEPDLQTIFSQHERPLDQLASGERPAVVLRNVWSPEQCTSLVQQLIDEELLYDPQEPIPEKFRPQIIPEGYYREGRRHMPAYAWDTEIPQKEKARIDIGSSLGYRGSNREGFFAHSAETNALFDRLFENRDNPVELLYDHLQKLSRDKRVVTAHEPDGCEYGRAIIRAHYGGYTYKPHFDSVRLREKRDDYAVSRFEHQFAGVLVLQNSSLGDQTAQGILHRCLWEPDVDPWLKSATFHEYAEQHKIENVEVHLQPGDLYFFNTRLIHEVPGLSGELPRIVLATFIGFSPDEDEIFVWS
ncbi:MAG: hypothetical protein HUJ26_05925 [Planctomycetaceae bacterium]|nr:hypothetical protein [Planctomycetaceae bacterium]